MAGRLVVPEHGVCEQKIKGRLWFMTGMDKCTQRSCCPEGQLATSGSAKPFRSRSYFLLGDPQPMADDGRGASICVFLPIV